MKPASDLVGMALDWEAESRAERAELQSQWYKFHHSAQLTVLGTQVVDKARDPEELKRLLKLLLF